MICFVDIDCKVATTFVQNTCPVEDRTCEDKKPCHVAHDYTEIKDLIPKDDAVTFYKSG